MNRIKRATMTDVAERAGVSQTTVSFVLNGIEAGLPERTKKRVMDAARELNYSPNDAARRLASKKSRVVGLALYDITDVMDYGQAASIVMTSMYKAAERKAHRLAVYTTHERQETGEDLETYFAVPVRSREVDGVVVWDHYVDQQRLISSYRDGLPIVTLDRHVDEVPCVVPDYDDGIRQVVEALVAKGHRKLCLFVGTAGVYRDVRIRSAFDKAVRQAGLSHDDVIIREEKFPPQFDEETGRAFADEIIGMADRPTAVICGYDKFAIAVLVRLRERGVKVPEEMAVVGCAGLPVSSNPAFRLSTLDLRQDLMATHAVELVLRMVKGEDLTGTRIIVQPQLVVRSTF